MTSIVLACGNALRGDDGVAPYLAHQLYGAICDANTEIVCSHQWLPEQAEDLSLATFAIFIVSWVALPPGEIRVRPVHAEREAAVATSHSLTPPQLMALARDLFGGVTDSAILLCHGGM